MRHPDNSAVREQEACSIVRIFSKGEDRPIGGNTRNLTQQEIRHADSVRLARKRVLHSMSILTFRQLGPKNRSAQAGSPNQLSGARVILVFSCVVLLPIVHRS